MPSRTESSTTPAASAGVWRYIRRPGYAPIPAGPDPDELAQRLHDSRMAKNAVKRLSEFDRFHQKHTEHRHSLIKGIGSLAAITLGLSPAIPGTYHACHTDDAVDCALKVGAIIGGALAIGIGIWSASDLWRHPVTLRKQVDRVSNELAAVQHGKTGQVSVSDVMQQYERMSYEQRLRLRQRLEQHVRDSHRRPPEHSDESQPAMSVLVA